MSEPREEVGPYLVYEQLGSGGMATVHRAEQRGIAGFRRVVALKRLHANVAADPELLKSFIHEARLASYLKHTNVAQTFDLGKVGETYFIAMEFVPGPTLAQLMRQCAAAAGPIPLGIVLSILIQICDALDHAHNLCDESGSPLGIIHRDISPSNIIVSNTGTVKLIDFGIAKANNADVRTQTGMIKGKFGYIAPEYLTGQLDLRGDLFGAGVIAHELITTRPLFLGRNDFDTLNRLREMPILPPSRFNERVTSDLDDIVMTALERDPDRRWQSAAAMRNALHNAMRDLGAVTGQQVFEWVEWAFTQLPGPEPTDARRAFDRYDDPSLLIDFGASGAPGGGSPFAVPTPDPTAEPPPPLPSAFAPGASPPSGFAPHGDSFRSASPYASDLSIPPTSPGFAPTSSRRAARAPEVLPPSAFEPATPPSGSAEPRDSVPTVSDLALPALPPSAFEPVVPQASAFAPETLPASAFAPHGDLLRSPETLPPSELPVVSRTKSRGSRQVDTPKPETLPPETLPASAFAPETPPPAADVPVIARTKSRTSRQMATTPPTELPPSAFAPETLPPSAFAEPPPEAIPPPLVAVPSGPPVDPAVKLAAAMLAPTLPAPVSAPKLLSAPQSAAARAKAATTPPVVVARDKPSREKPPSMPPAVPGAAGKPPSVPPAPPVREKSPSMPPPVPGAAGKPPPLPAGAAKPPSIPPAPRSGPPTAPPPIPGAPPGAKPPPLPVAARAGASGSKPPPLPREPQGDALGATEPNLPRYDSPDAADPHGATGPMARDSLDPTDPMARMQLGASGPNGGTLDDYSSTSPRRALDSDSLAAAPAASPRARSLEELAGLPSPRWAATGSDPADAAPARRSRASIPSAPKPSGTAPAAGAPAVAAPAAPAAPSAKPDDRPASPPKRATGAMSAKEDPAQTPPDSEQAAEPKSRWWILLLLLLLAAAAAAAGAYYLDHFIEL